MTDIKTSRSASTPALTLVRTADEIRDDRTVIRFNLAAAQAAEDRAENDADPLPGDDKLIAALDGWRGQEYDRYWNAVHAAEQAEIPDATALVETALAALGDSADEVAAALTKAGIRGIRDCAAGSPIAEYLYKQNIGFDEVEVDPDGGLVRIGRVRHLCGAYDPDPARLPAVVAEFELQFDAGRWLHLDKDTLAVAA